MAEAADAATLREATDAFRSPPKRGDRRLARRKRMAAYAMLTPGALYLAFSFIIPLILIVFLSLKSGGLLSGGYSLTWEFGNYARLLDQYWDIYLRSLLFSGTATAICILLAYPLAYYIAFYGGRWKSTLFLLILVPFFVSYVIRTVQWRFILGDSGLIFGPLKDIGVLPADFHVLQTPYAVIAGLAYNFIPFTALPLYVSLERIDRRLVEAAKDLYASKAQAFRKVVLPLSFPGVFAAVVLTFVPATGDYVNSQQLGSPSTFMIGQVIQQKFLGAADQPAAATLSVVLMVGMLLVALAYARALGTEDSTLAAAA
ncbi:MAG: ABC transporter permease [Actinomycetota bacterium]